MESKEWIIFKKVNNEIVIPSIRLYFNLLFLLSL